MRKRLRRAFVRGLRALRPVRRSLSRLRSPSAAPGQIHLVWAGDPARRLGVAWQSLALGGSSWIELRSSSDSTWRRHAAQSRSAPGPRGFLHSCEVGELEPGTVYEYRVSTEVAGEPIWSEVYRARTASVDPQAAITVGFFADSAVAGRRDGYSAAMPRALDELAADDAFIVLGGGDYAYANTDDRFLDPADAVDTWLKQMEPVFGRSIFMPTFGNHEIALGERISDWAPRFVFPSGEAGIGGEAPSYSFDLGSAHFVALCAPGSLPGRAHLDWLERDLAASRSAGVRWLIVYQHAPIFAHGSSHPARAEIREALMPIFERHGVDLHLSAHDQSYERTRPLGGGDGGGDGQKPRVGGDGAARYRAGEGVIYAKVSPFGKLSSRGGDFSRLPSALPDPVVVQNDDCHHHALLRIDAQRLEVEVRGVPETVGPPRRVDRFVIEQA